MNDQGTFEVKDFSTIELEDGVTSCLVAIEKALENGALSLRNPSATKMEELVANCFSGVAFNLRMARKLSPTMKYFMYQVGCRIRRHQVEVLDPPFGY